MDRRTAGGLSIVVAATGAVALVLQVVWQRVVALRTGVDLVSAALTVTAFLAGLGVGSAAGGTLADRWGRAACGRAFAAAAAGVAASALVSVPVLTRVVPAGAGEAIELLVTFAVLVVPTSLMGATLPLLLRAVVGDPSRAGRTLGWLASVNTLGSAAGALVGGWVLLGTFGAATTVRLAAAVELAAAAGALAVVRRSRPGSAVPDPRPSDPDPSDPDPSDPRASDPVADGPDGTGPGTRTWPWFAVVAATGAVAVGFETVCFRVVDSMVRSNSYTFPGVLAMWLALFAVGAAAGGRLVGRVGAVRRWFLGLQAGVAVAVAAGLVVLVRVVPSTPLWSTVSAWFNSDGLAGGFGGISPGPTLVVAVLLPLLLMGPPVLLMGAALPFAQQLVTEDLDTLGRRAGWLGAANLAGNVAGGLVTGLVLVDRWGSGGAARVLVAVLLATVAGAAVLTRPGAPLTRPGAPLTRPGAPREVRRAVGVGGTAVVAVALLAAMPTTGELWTFLHDGGAVELVVEEDRSCGTVAKAFDDGQVQLHINGASQNGWPFDEFHLALGLVPAVLSERPGRVLVVGFGIGSTTAGLLAEPRTGSVTTVELCGGNERVVRRLGGPDRPGLAEVLDDPRQTTRTDDGRAALREPGAPFDLVVTDTVRTTSAASGNTYSVEYYELIRDRLAPDGLMATWVPTGRVLASVQSVFPHVVLAHTPGYNGSRLAVASRSPIEVDRATLAARLAAAEVPDDRRAALAEVLGTLSGRCDPSLPPLTEDDLNRDLWARDEYFLNHDVRGDPRRLRCPEDLPGHDGT